MVSSSRDYRLGLADCCRIVFDDGSDYLLREGEIDILFGGQNPHTVILFDGDPEITKEGCFAFWDSLVESKRISQLTNLRTSNSLIQANYVDFRLQPIEGPAGCGCCCDAVEDLRGK